MSANQSPERELEIYLGHQNAGTNAEQPPAAGSILPEKPSTADLEARLERIRDLHQREAIAVHEGYGEEAWCPTCHQHYPCATIRIIDKGDKTSE